MTENFTLNVIWKEENIKKVDEKNLSEKECEIYYFNPSKSREGKQVFSRKNVGKELKKKFTYGVVGLVAASLILFGLGEANSNNELVDKFAIALLLTIAVLLLGLLSLPFSTNSNLIFSQDFDYGQNKILKQNALGLISTVLNLEYPQHIGRVVLNKKTNNSYVTFREKEQDKISDNAPILVIDSNNEEQLLMTERLLKSFIDNAHHEVDFVKL